MDTMTEETMYQLIGKVDRGQGEEVQVNRRVYKGTEYVDIRLWYQGKGETCFLPTKKGIAIKREQVKELIKALVEVV